jgi:hypothetical protein
MQGPLTAQDRQSSHVPAVLQFTPASEPPAAVPAAPPAAGWTMLQAPKQSAVTRRIA